MYSVILESLSSKSDLKAIVGAIANVFGIDKKGAVEKAKNLPITLAKNLPEKEAKLMADMFSSLGAGIKVLPPLGEIPARPIRDFKTELPKKGIHIGCLFFIMLCMVAFAGFASLKYEWIIEQFKPNPDKAEKLLQKGKMNEARKSIQKQLVEKPNDIDLLTLQGKFYIGAYRKKMDSEHWKSYGESGAFPELDSAIAFFRKAEALNHNDGSISRWISITEQMRKNLAEAEIAARRAIFLDPSDTDNWNQLGSVLVDIEDVSQAEQTFLNVLKTDPKNATSLKNLAILNLYYTKDAERAAYFLFTFLNQKEAAMDTDTYQIRMDLTAAMIGDFNPPWERLSPPKLPFDEYEKRRIRFSESPNLNNDPLLQEQLGLLFMSKGERYAAENCFIRAIELNPNNESSRKMMAIIYLKEGNYERTFAIIKNATENNVKDPFF